MPKSIKEVIKEENTKGKLSKTGLKGFLSNLISIESSGLKTSIKLINI